jgi:acyl carrier protein
MMQTDTRIACRTVPDRDEVLESVAQIVAEQIGAQADRIAEGNALVEDLGCDSLDIVEIAMELEEHFDISIPDESDKTARTIGDVTDGVLQLLAVSNVR